MNLERTAGPGQSGVGLLELLVAIAILALLLAVAVPSMRTMIERNRLKTAAQALAEDLHWTRSEAIKRNRVLQLRLDPDHWCYGVDEPGAVCDCRVPAGTAGACSLKRVSGADYPGIRLEASFVATRFEPRRATAINGRLSLVSPQGSELRILLSRLGRVRLCSPSGDMPGYDACDG